MNAQQRVQIAVQEVMKDHGDEWTMEHVAVDDGVCDSEGNPAVYVQFCRMIHKGQWTYSSYAPWSGISHGRMASGWDVQHQMYEESGGVIILSPLSRIEAVSDEYELDRQVRYLYGNFQDQVGRSKQQLYHKKEYELRQTVKYMAEEYRMAVARYQQEKPEGETLVDWVTQELELGWHGSEDPCVYLDGTHLVAWDFDPRDVSAEHPDVIVKRVKVAA